MRIGLQSRVAMLFSRHESFSRREITVAAQLRSAVEISFAHWSNLQDFVFEDEFDRWIETISAVKHRRDFALATIQFMAGFRNGHTAFNDRWLWRTAGQATGFAVKKLQNEWIITTTAVPDLSPGDSLFSIDGEPISVWAERIAPFVSASTAWSRSDAIFSRFYLLPPAFELELMNGRRMWIERGKWTFEQSRRPSLLQDDIPVLRIPSFGSSEFEDEATELVARVLDRPALIVDIRGNGGGNTPTRLLGSLMDRP
jgi:carboxyl-terminal processing protease